MRRVIAARKAATEQNDEDKQSAEQQAAGNFSSIDSQYWYYRASAVYTGIYITRNEQYLRQALTPNSELLHF